MSEAGPALSAAELAQRIDGFWLRFREGEAALVRKPVREQVEEINEVLEACLDGLALEMSADDGDLQVELIATAHGNADNFPLLLDFVKRAPPLKHYTLSAFRARTESPDFPMRMDDFELATSDVLIGHLADEGRVGMEVMFARELPSDMQDHARNMAFIMLDHVLGEYDFAVKVGFVDFVDAFSDEVSASTPLDKFGPVLDSFWTNELGHTGLFPSGEHRWSVMTVVFGGGEDGDGDSEEAGEEDEEGEEGDKAIVAVNQSANAIAARPDLGHAIELRLPVEDHAALDRARELQEQIATRLELQHAGILSHTVVRNGRRLANYYVGDLPAALGVVDASLHGASFTGAELTHAFDPSWSKYFNFAG
jgi:hypothetical protein